MSPGMALKQTLARHRHILSPGMELMHGHAARAPKRESPTYLAQKKEETNLAKIIRKNLDNSSNPS